MTQACTVKNWSGSGKFFTKGKRKRNNRETNWKKWKCLSNSFSLSQRKLGGEKERKSVYWHIFAWNYDKIKLMKRIYREQRFDRWFWKQWITRFLYQIPALAGYILRVIYALLNLRPNLRALVRQLIRDVVTTKSSLHVWNIVHRPAGYLEAGIDGNILHPGESGHVHETEVVAVQEQEQQIVQPLESVRLNHDDLIPVQPQWI